MALLLPTAGRPKDVFYLNSKFQAWGPIMGFCDYGNGALSFIMPENFVSRRTAISCLGAPCTVEFVQADPLSLNFHAVSNFSLHQIFKFIHWRTINLALYLDSEIRFIQIFKYQMQYHILKKHPYIDIFSNFVLKLFLLLSIKPFCPCTT